MQSFKKVAILGAGVSKALESVPIQNDFFVKFDEECHASFDIKKTFPRLASLYNFFKINKNIEGYFSILHALSRSEHSFKQLQALELLPLYRREIAFWLSKYNHEKNEDFKRKFESKLSTWKPDDTIFISTNYDEIFEHLILGEDINFFGFLPSPFGKWKILKPHGSISWMEIRDLFEMRRIDKTGDTIRQVGLSRRPLEYLRMPINKINELNRGDNTSYFDDKKQPPVGLTPVLAPFFFQKEDWFLEKWGELLGQIFLKCNDVIENCDELWVIGYSIPDADWTFAEAFQKISNSNRIKLNLVFPYLINNEDSIRETRKTITKFESIFRCNFDYYNQCAKDFFINGPNQDNKIKSETLLDQLKGK